MSRGIHRNGNIDVDPLLLLPYYDISDISDCVNSGTSTGAPVDDLDGDSRDAPPDMVPLSIISFRMQFNRATGIDPTTAALI